jgi:hypothetical protein
MKRRIHLQPVLGGLEITLHGEKKKKTIFVWRFEIRELADLLSKFAQDWKL